MSQNLRRLRTNHLVRAHENYVRNNTQAVVVALQPARNGIGFVVFQGEERAVDWGVMRLQPHNHKEYLKRIEEELFDVYLPDAVIIQDGEDRPVHYSRVQLLIEDIEQRAVRNDIHCYRYTRKQVRAVFQGENITNKDDVASEIAKRFPEFKTFLPPRRKIYQPEHHRMYIFDAIALALTYFYQEKHGHKSDEAKEDMGKYVTQKIDEYLISKVTRPKKSNSSLVVKPQYSLT